MVDFRHADNPVPFSKSNLSIEVPKTHRDYPALDCPLCGIERKPRSLNKDGSVTYSCPPDHVHHGSRYTWRIAENGDLID